MAIPGGQGAGVVSRNSPGDAGGWRVEFEGGGVRSRIDAWWDSGTQARIRDDGASGGSGSGGGD